MIIKTILIYLVISCYAEANDADIDHTKPMEKFNTNERYIDYISSRKVCLFSDDNFQGNSRCFYNGDKMDLYEEDDTMIGNDKTSSIHIPDGMLATIYKNNDYSPPYFNLTESIGQHDLAGLYMDNRISGISVSNVPIEGCSEHCVIIKRRKLPLVDIFSQYWDDPTYPNKQVLLSFDINDKSDFMVELSLGPIIWFSKKEVIIFDSNNNEPLVFLIHPDANRFVLLFHLNNNNIAVDYMEGRGTEQIALSPTITLANAPFDRPIETSAIIINNTGESPQVIDQIVMAASTESIQSVHHRSERDTAGTLGCAFIPALAIYNYITHSRCDQVDKLWGQISHWFSGDNKKKAILIVGNTPLLKPQPALPEYKDNQASPLTLTLNKINTQLHHQALTLPATARFCRTSIDNILATCYPRSPDDNCPQWVSRVLADFTALFGHSLRDWTPEQLQDVVTRIDAQQATGYAVNDQDTEDHLVNEIRGAVERLGLVETIQQITRAFEYARLNYATYLVHNPSASESPIAAQSLPLGEYSLSLESYHYPTEPHAVRIRENNEWVVRPDLHFEVEIIENSATDRSAIRLTRAVMRHWFNDYRRTALTTDQQGNLLTDLDRTTKAAQITSASLLLELEGSTNDYLFVVVRLNGEIVSVLGANGGQDESEEYYIDVSVSKPRNVLTPNEEGNVRGAGTAAVHELARYLKQKGVKTLRSHVISQPSARVKSKLGFIHDEL
ncbi:TPA: GNAT family N-acetyltransferase [Yersinia enterocolitica]|uniref:GNAT family N-acetyltransferase n=2 Tax=Yersinia enterocolitica TaxID=630 RepID=UPI0037053115